MSAALHYRFLMGLILPDFWQAFAADDLCRHAMPSSGLMDILAKRQRVLAAGLIKMP